MNISTQNDFSVVSSSNGKVFINGEDIPLPKGMTTNSQTIIDGKIYIDGYEFFPESKTFKKTLKAFWHKLI